MYTLYVAKGPNNVLVGFRNDFLIIKMQRRVEHVIFYRLVQEENIPCLNIFRFF